MSLLRCCVALALCAGLALSATGCGQRGPLYLPDEEQPEQEARVQSPEEDQEESDEENS